MALTIQARAERSKVIEDLHHIQIAMPKGQEDIARAFYCDVLGFSEVAKPRELHGRGGVWFEQNRVRLHIGVDDPFVPARKAHPGFRVASLRAAMAHLAAHNIAFQTGEDLPDIRRVYITDPFGNRIEILEVISP